MARLVFIVGESGTGKSTSLRKFDPKETVIINADAKDLPFKGFGKFYNTENKNYVPSSNPNMIMTVLKNVNERKEVKRVVIDTWSRIMTDYIMTKEFREAPDGREAWARMAASQYDLMNAINNDFRNDLIIYLMCHPEAYYDDSGLLNERIAVQGQQLKRFNPESFSSIVLYTEVRVMPGEAPEFYFRTVNNGADTCKTPMEMFSEPLVKNDLNEIEKTIRSYYD